MIWLYNRFTSVGDQIAKQPEYQQFLKTFKVILNLADDREKDEFISTLVDSALPNDSLITYDRIMTASHLFPIVHIK